MKYQYDAIVIGAGAGGLTAAIGLAKVGKKVVLIERDKMGGECTNSGCVPSKALIHLAREIHDAEKISGSTKETDMLRTKVMDKVRKKILRIRLHESPEVLEDMGVHVELGNASFVDAHTISITKAGGSRKSAVKKLTARKIIIATGSRPRHVQIPGLDKSQDLSNENLFQLKEIPKAIIILGGGPIGCEVAQAYAYLGVKVTIVTSTEYIVPREEQDIAKITTKTFRSQGIDVISKSTIIGVEGGEAIIEKTPTINTGTTRDTMKSRKTIRLKYDYILQAIGREPNIDSLGLENTDIQYSGQGIEIDEHYRVQCTHGTKCKHIFAVGDVTTSPKFTHLADDQARHVVKKILLPLTRAQSKPLPKVTYLEEEIASVGKSWQEVEGGCCEEIMRIEVPYTSTDRAQTDEIKRGLLIVIARRLSGKIIGVHIVGKNAGEIINVFTVAMQHGISMWKLNQTMFPYPVQSQLIKKSTDIYVATTFKDLKKDLKHYAKKHTSKITAVIFWVILFTWFWQTKEAHNLSALDIARELYGYSTGTIYGPLIYVAAYAIRPLIFFPATILTILSGLLFGFWAGALYTIIGGNLSASFAYILGKFIGKDLIPAEGVGVLTRWQNKLQQNSFISVLIMRLIYLPFDLVNFGCGILRVRWVPYAIATFIGVMPGSLTFVSLGASIENIEQFDPAQVTINPSQLVISVALFFSGLIVAKIIKKKQK